MIQKNDAWVTESQGYHLCHNKIRREKIEECCAIRLTEMYLLKAEAVRAGKDLGDAKEPLKTVMGHAGSRLTKLMLSQTGMNCFMNLKTVKTSCLVDRR